MKKPSSMATLTPAYGRDYGSKTEAIEAFRTGKDFVYNHFSERACYININEYSAGQMVKIRYNNKKHVAFYSVCDIDLRK